MINQVKRAIQSYYPDQYLFLEFLRTGGWQVTAGDHVTTRYQTVLDGITFELDEYVSGNPGVMVLAFYPNLNRPRDVHIMGPRVRITGSDSIDDKIRYLMTEVYYSNRMRGRSYNAVI